MIWFSWNAHWFVSQYLCEFVSLVRCVKDVNSVLFHYVCIDRLEGIFMDKTEHCNRGTLCKQVIDNFNRCSLQIHAFFQETKQKMVNKSFFVFYINLWKYFIIQSWICIYSSFSILWVQRLPAQYFWKLEIEYVIEIFYCWKFLHTPNKSMYLMCLTVKCPVLNLAF